MPFVPNPVPILIVKAVGYSIAGYILQRIYQSRFNFAVFALIRMFSGIVAGVITLPIFFATASGNNEIVMYLYLLLVRILVWGFLIWAIFERKDFHLKRFLLLVCLGIVWSFTLDYFLSLLEKSFPDSMKIPFC